MTSSELIALKVAHEQEWAHARFLEHHSWQTMRIIVNRHPDDGGLGYDLSIHALRGLVAGWRAINETAPLTRAEAVERELADLDLVQRLALASMQSAAAIGGLDVHATKIHLDAGDRRRKLLGLDAPIETKIDMTVTDAATAELEAMLAEAGIETGSGATGRPERG